MSRLTSWTIYDHPSDYPEHYVAREWLILPDGPKATESVMIASDLDKLRDTLAFEFGLLVLDRADDDDPTIVETWL